MDRRKAEIIVEVLETAFPELGTEKEINGGDAVNEINAIYAAAKVLTEPQWTEPEDFAGELAESWMNGNHSHVIEQIMNLAAERRGEIAMRTFNALKIIDDVTGPDASFISSDADRFLGRIFQKL